MYRDLHINYLLFLSDFNETHFLDRFQVNIKVLNLMKIRPVGADLFHAVDGRTDGQTENRKLTDTFRNFCQSA